MSPSNKLAIVIPAYKLKFFRQALASIAGQTCTRFTLYIGDDGSPEDLASVVDEFRDKVPIVYNRFTDNAGGANLIAHWNRCIEMVQGEEWVWLFSDDDYMDERCVELFYNHIDVHPEDNLVHFNIRVVNENNEQIFKTKTFPERISTSDYFRKVMNMEVYSCVVEFVFRKTIFDKAGGFQHFDLAWSSDTATWMKLSAHGGIITIDGALVHWRLSNYNISSVKGNKSIVLRKLNAGIDFLHWSAGFFRDNGLADQSGLMQRFRWLVIGLVYTDQVSIPEKIRLVKKSAALLHMKGKSTQALVIWAREELKRTAKRLLGK